MSSVTRDQHFPALTAENAGADARPTLQTMQAKFGGRLPPALARMAASPPLMRAFLSGNELFESTSLTPLQRETLVMTMAVRHGCHVCVELHTAALRRHHATPELIADLRGGTTPSAADLAALQRFCLDVIDHAGDVTDTQLDRFLASGFTAAQALEVVLGIGVYTMSTFANRLTGAGVG